MTDVEHPKRLEAIRTREAKATPGPWTVGNTYQEEWWMHATEIKDDSGDPYGAVTLVPASDDDKPGPDAQFIAHAREDIPWLLAQLDAANAEIAALRERAVVWHAIKSEDDLPPIDNRVRYWQIRYPDWAYSIQMVSLLEQRGQRLGVVSGGIHLHESAVLEAWAELPEAWKEGE